MTSFEDEEGSLTRRSFFRTAAATVAMTGLVKITEAQNPAQANAVQLSPLHASTEASQKTPGPFEGRNQRVGFALVGLGDLTINEILPAFAKSKFCKVTALVSGDRTKALKLAAQYDVKESSIYDYKGYEHLADNPDVQVIYIVLPNSMHAEYVIRGAKTGKQILCEKPMATNAKDCERMIDACKAANIKLMIAYRQQYEPMNRALLKMVREGRLGKLRSIVASNAQNQGNPDQWRQKIALAGGGCLPDVGIYCLNAARFLSGEEPTEVHGMTHQPKDDPRFAEVEETCSFELKFPSGLIASCSSGYGAHRSQFLRVEGDKGWAELNPAFGYTGLKLRSSKTEDGHDVVSEPSIEAMDQFALEMDHLAQCVQSNLQPHTPGEEGLQDQRIVTAIYDSARSGKSVSLTAPKEPTRGPDLTEI